MIHSFNIALNMELRFAAFKTLFIFIASFLAKGCNAGFDYGDALGKGILFYEGQRSGPLPSSQRVTWRSDSGLQDGKSVGVDLRGGYYDAGDNVKFGLPMAFTITMLSWSVIEYGNQLKSSGQLQHALEAIKWGTDYLMKAHPEPDVLWGEVGDGNTDHNCWQRPEDMTTSRQAYKIDANNPGSDLAGETAAAMAAASLALKSQTDYSNLLLTHSRQLFSFADRYRGKYVNSIQIAQKYYDSKSGYADELLWAAMWLHEATGETQYLKYVADNAGPFGGTGWAITEFSWDVKYAGVQVLASKVLMEGRGGAYTSVLQNYQSKAQYFLCACLQKNNGPQVRRTPGGLMYIRSWNNMQYVTSGSFLMTVYSDYLTNSGQNLKCGAGAVNPSELFSFAKSQIDYVLGDNPRATSYMVGYGSNFPQQIHHRASSIVSIKVDPSFVSCRGGYQTWYSRRQADPNVLVGALVGGPDQNDNFGDERDNWEQTEPATYNNGPLVGVLARLHGGGSTADPSASPMKTVSTPGVVVHKSDEVVVSQKVASSWIYRGQTYYKYAVTVLNNSKKTMKQLKLSIDELKGPIWGVSKIDGSSNSYTFPSWMQSLAPGASFDFVYIHASSQATVSVSDYLLN